MGKIRVDFEDGGGFPEMNSENTYNLADQDLSLAWCSNPLDDNTQKPLGYPMIALHLKAPDGHHIFWSGKLQSLIDAVKALSDKIADIKPNEKTF
jgi:hypothetical protein